LPICILGNIKSCSSYIEAGKYFTPYSVSVRGYYRRDGTYINPYNRRPPGGARHDVPYENTRTKMALLFFVCLIGDMISIAVFVNKSTSEIERLQKIEKDRKATFNRKNLKKNKFYFFCALGYSTKFKKRYIIKMQVL